MARYSQSRECCCLPRALELPLQLFNGRFAGSIEAERHLSYGPDTKVNKHRTLVAQTHIIFRCSVHCSLLHNAMLSVVTHECNKHHTLLLAFALLISIIQHFIQFYTPHFFLILKQACNDYISLQKNPAFFHFLHFKL